MSRSRSAQVQHGKRNAFKRAYGSSLLSWLRTRQQASAAREESLGARAAQAGMSTLDVASIHHVIMDGQVLPTLPLNRHAGVIRRSGCFFAAVMPTSENAGRAIIRLQRDIGQLSRRTAKLASANLAMSQDISERESVERNLKQGKRRYDQLLRKSAQQQEHLRRMSRQILSAQEDERRHISRELHDVIAQTLTGINIRLAALKQEAAIDARGLDRSIARTQLLVVRAVGIVHRFARDLRPAVLDDLGLIPALQTLIKPLAQRAGIHARLEVCAEVERMPMSQRTVLFRVAQETLTNVARHAHASLVTISIRREAPHMCMRIHDDGKAFDVQRALQPNGNRHLGLLGMRERLEMFGGSLSVISSPTNGTTITALIPLVTTTRPHVVGRSAIRRHDQ